MVAVLSPGIYNSNSNFVLIISSFNPSIVTDSTQVPLPCQTLPPLQPKLKKESRELEKSLTSQDTTFFRVMKQEQKSQAPCAKY